MWDPLLNDFPETVHGFRSMLAVKYLLHLEQEYDRGTVGAEYIRDLIGVLRCKSYVEATRRYNNLNTRIQGAEEAELRQPIHEPCCCPHCPRHQKQNMGQQAHVSEAQDVQTVSKPRCS
ncbi:precoat protein [East African cassava mosaic Zanzibar virus]|uniref:Protein V2 n=1 Tax=East African cassava mosaic Zanzibar virus TaxID=223275 RepID=Q8V384_9GEMI|nr:precoat protein [East African cassava mosaic Zanzibar virus]AAL60506.1 precoat protein [East African cassava mosaic Zanzibar virus]